MDLFARENTGKEEPLIISKYVFKYLLKVEWVQGLAIENKKYIEVWRVVDEYPGGLKLLFFIFFKITLFLHLTKRNKTRSTIY